MTALKTLTTLLVAAMIVMTLAGCVAAPDGRGNSSTLSSPAPADERLTTTKAGNALKQWAGSHGSVTVGGIQEVPRENAAKADITLSDYHFTAKDSIIGDQPKIYSGAGTAIFIRYNDGRWMLSKVGFTMRGGMTFTFDNINIEAR